MSCHPVMMTIWPREELTRLFRLAWPLLLSQLAMSGMAVTDTLVAGQAGVRDLAAVAVGSNLLIIALMGIYVSGSGRLISSTTKHSGFLSSQCFSISTGVRPPSARCGRW